MITVPIFEPLWRCRYGIFEHYGGGGLGELWEKEPEIQSMEVKTPSFSVTVKPRTGEILTDSLVSLKTKPGKLIWFRQMYFEINTHDRNERSNTRCNFYGIGIENESGRVGYRLFEDGRLTLGI